MSGIGGVRVQSTKTYIKWQLVVMVIQWSSSTIVCTVYEFKKKTCFLSSHHNSQSFIKNPISFQKTSFFDTSQNQSWLTQELEKAIWHFLSYIENKYFLHGRKWEYEKDSFPPSRCNPLFRCYYAFISGVSIKVLPCSILKLLFSGFCYWHLSCANHSDFKS